MPRCWIFAGLIALAQPLAAGQLTLVWESTPDLRKPESAIYDAEHDRLYISNIQGKYLARDGNGFISILKLDGSIEQLAWVAKGLDNPQGLALVEGDLFVADIDRLVRIDGETGVITATYPAKGAEFLNDVTASPSGEVFVSDCRRHRIYRWHDGQFRVWLETPELQAPNGLLWTPEGLVVLAMQAGQCFRVDWHDQSLTLLASGIANADGVVADGEGGFFISGAWQGQIFHLDAKGRLQLVLDLGPEEVIAADLTYVPEQRLLIVPTLHETVRAYRWP